MPSYKSDSSFFHLIAMGAIGSRVVRADMASHGHVLVELERGALDAKIWKDTKRKRIRIPDLVCLKCGRRVEVRTKSEQKLSMSHSPTIPERAWDRGMVGEDLIAMPICDEVATQDATVSAHWTRGQIDGETSYWNEKEWVTWRPQGAVNYFTVEAFRRAAPDKTMTKGAGDGSETTLIWSACFSPTDGVVTKFGAATITVTDGNGKSHRRGSTNLRRLVAIDEQVRLNQLLACNVVPCSDAQLRCGGDLSESDLGGMLESKHLPVRFAGVKLARLRRETSLNTAIAQLAIDEDEDIYVRLEAKAYLASVLGTSVTELFTADLAALDKADQLEAVIAIGEVGSEAAAVLLAEILSDTSKGYFLRSAAAYCLGRIDSTTARSALVAAFTASAHRLREDALAALASGGLRALGDLLGGLTHNDVDIQAGCAEVLRWMSLRSDTPSEKERIVKAISSILETVDRPLLAVWLGGQLPEPLMRAALGTVLDRDPSLAYSLAVSWAFARSWIAPIHDAFHPPKL